MVISNSIEMSCTRRCRLRRLDTTVSVYPPSIVRREISEAKRCCSSKRKLLFSILLSKHARTHTHTSIVIWRCSSEMNRRRCTFFDSIKSGKLKSRANLFDQKYVSYKRKNIDWNWINLFMLQMHFYSYKKILFRWMVIVINDKHKKNTKVQSTYCIIRRY